MSNHKLGIIVPYRDRPNQLKTFTERIAGLINIPYELIIIEQADDKEFNRGKLLNIGFIKAIVKPTYAVTRFVFTAQLFMRRSTGTNLC